MRSTRETVCTWTVAGALVGVLGCAQMDKVFCNGACGLSPDESARISALGNLEELQQVDPSNKYVYDGNEAVVQLGRQFFWDTRFSGLSAGTDSINRPVPYGRAPKGQPVNISCQSCHDLKQGGADSTKVPGNVSLGATWTDANANSVVNAGYLKLILWPGRADSLWMQAAGSMEASLGSNRSHVAWVIATYYRAAYEAVFTEYPMPMTGTIADLTATIQTSGAQSGQCIQTSGCPSTCRAVQDMTSGATGCFPRFPLDGKPGKKPGCQPGDPSEPYGDAFDCMDPDDQTAVIRIQVNFAKAIAAFEFKLVSRNSAFDKYAADLQDGNGDASTAISPEAKAGARLFVGKAGCADCHNTPLLSDQNFYNIGVLQTGQGVPTVADCPKGGVCDCSDTPNNCLPFGVIDGLTKMRKNPFQRIGKWSDDPTDMSRAQYYTGPLTDYPKGGFMTAPLRDVALTAPYMHDGSLATLEDVVAHYNRGGETSAVGTMSARIKPLYLTSEEQAQLVAFLKTLTGEPLTNDLSDPPMLP